MKFIPKTVFGLFPLLFSLDASAQITRDGTTSTTVTPTETGVRIDNGNRNGGNLFHSFGEFSIPTGSEAFFNNASDIANIFSRVTGGNISNINGLIRANGAANLFLINPAGIVFGNNARLQLGGSFYGSTADSIIFPDGEFSATDLDNPPLITVNAPIGLGFRDNPQPIVNQSIAQEINTGEVNIGLKINAGNTLNLIGGEINFAGGKITAQGAKVWLGGLAEAGIVNLDENLTPSIADNASRANISFSQNSITSETSRVNVANDGSGVITIIGHNITLAEASQLIGGIAESSGTEDSQAGDITLNATGAMELNGSSVVENSVKERAIGNSGDINVTAQSLTMTDGSFFSASTFGNGNGGNINLKTTDAVILDGIVESNQQSSRVASGVASGAEGNGGNIYIDAGSLSLTNGATLNARSVSEGNAGNIIINTDGAVAIAGLEKAQSLQIAIDTRLGDSQNTGNDAVGNGGNIEITANSLSLRDRVSVRSSTSGQGNGGQIQINVQENISIDSNSSISNNIDSLDAVGDTGRIEITTANLTLTNGGRINANTSGQGNAGKIIINASDTVSIADGNLTGIFSAVGDTGVGNTGGIEITTTNLNLTNGGEINANTFGRGNVGKIIINASESISVESNNLPDINTGVFSAVGDAGVGNAEGVEITTANLTLNNGGRINTSTFGQGNAGDITINAGETIVIDGKDLEGVGSGIFSNVESGAEASVAGDINLTTSDLTISNGGTVSASTFGQGNSGSLKIDANDLNLSEGTISATNEPSEATNEAQEGGNITLEIADNIFLSNNSTISARAGENASGGNIQIEADLIVAFPNQNNDITANAVGGNGGNITIVTESILGIEERLLNPITNDINASSQSGIDGAVFIETPDNNPFRETTELSDIVISPGIVTANACKVSGMQYGIDTLNTLIIKGKGGISVKPTQPFTADALIIDGELETSNLLESNNSREMFEEHSLEQEDMRNFSVNSGNVPSQIQPVAYKDNGEPIYIARGIVKQEDGTVILTAVPHHNIPPRTPEKIDSCG